MNAQPRPVADQSPMRGLQATGAWTSTALGIASTLLFVLYVRFGFDNPSSRDFVIPIGSWNWLLRMAVGRIGVVALAGRVWT